MTAYLIPDAATMFRRSLRRMRRYPSLTMFIAGIPVVLLLLFVYVFGGTLGAGLGGAVAAPVGSPADRSAYVAYVVPGILLMTVAGVGQGTAIVVAMDMTQGIIARFRTMAIARASVLLGHVLGSVVQAALATVIVVVVALVIGFRPTTGPASWAAAGGLLVLTAFAVAWLSVALGLVTDSVETASNLPMILTFLPFLSSGFVPTASMPGPLAMVLGAPAVHADHRDAARPAAGYPDREQRAARRRVVPRDLGRRLPVGASPVRARAGAGGRVGELAGAPGFEPGTP